MPSAASATARCSAGCPSPASSAARRPVPSWPSRWTGSWRRRGAGAGGDRVRAVLRDARQLVAVWVAGRLRSRVTWHPARRLDQVVGLGVLGARGAAGGLDGRAAAGVRAVPDAVVPGAPLGDHPGGGRHAADRSATSTDRCAGSSTAAAPPGLRALQPTRIVDVPPADPALLQSASVAASVLGAQGAGGGAVLRPGIEGSGVVYAPERMLTNAHVVAGANQVQVEVVGAADRARGGLRPAGTSRCCGCPVWRSGRCGWPVPGPLWPGRHRAGLSGGRPFDVRPARVRDRDGSPGATSTARSGRTRHLHHPIGGAVGDSGGPLIATDGSILGIVFASALNSADTAFVLTADEVVGAGPRRAHRHPSGQVPRPAPSCRDLTRCCQAASRLMGGRPPRAEWPRRVL